MQPLSRRWVVLGAVLACLGATFPALASGPSTEPDTARSGYIVQFRAEPLATYSGDGPSAATAPRVTGRRKLDAASPEAVEYRRHLDGIERTVLRAAGLADGAVVYRYRTTLAGFSARLTGVEAARLRRQPQVASVSPDRVHVVRPRRTVPVDAEEARAAVGGPAAVHPATAVPAATLTDADLEGQSADFLGLPEGLWSRLGGPEQAGENLVVGVIDTGIYPEHPSFADQPVAPDGTPRYIGPAYGPPPPTWRGTCQAGEAFPATTCNNKLVGARYFADGWGVDHIANQDFLSARDADGHGTGVAAAAAGNYGVDPSYHGNDLGIGVISGIAPRARIAVYKALWAIPAFDGGGFGSDSDLAAAIDAAVADGVDVLNLSVGGLIEPPLPFTDQSILLTAASLALLRAYDAGVVSVLASGNSGPDHGTVEEPGVAPWVISAGSSALPTTYTATATVSGGPDGPTLTVEGISPTPAIPAAPLIEGAAAAAPGADPQRAARCAAGALDPALVKGKVVLCPGNAVVSSARLHELGAAGGIFYFQTIDFRYSAEDVWLPSVVVTAADAAAIRQLIASSPNPTASFTAGTLAPSTTGDIVVLSSGRGPAIGTANVLKPDVLAPGNDIITAQSPDVPPGETALFDFTQPGNLFRPINGSSFSVAITAGAAALLLALRPDLTPNEVKSALMTTARPDILEDHPVEPSVPARVTDIGAGRIDPNRAAEPGLVLDETTARMQAWLSRQDPARDPTLPTVGGSDLNLPSIAFDPLLGPRSTSRTFTSVDPQAGTWSVSFSGLPGVTASAEPDRFSIGPGATQALRFSFDPGDVAAGTPVEGAAVLTNEQDGRTVRLPVVLRPERFAVREQLNFAAPGPQGQAPLPVATGYDGDLSVQGYGFAAPETRRDQTVTLDPVDDDDPALDLSQPRVGVTVFDQQVPPGAQVLAAEIGGTVLPDDFADLDLLVFHDAAGDGFTMDDLVDSSEFVGSAENVLIRDPEPGAYRFSVRGFEADSVATFDLTTWLIADPAPDDPTTPPGPGLAITGDPVAVTPGGDAALTVEWRGLDQPGVYLGLVTFHDSATPGAGPPLEEMVLAVQARE